MKRGLAIVTGVLMILAASFIAAGNSSQDNAQRPQVAQQIATAFHVTPSATSPPMLTPLPASTPRHITRRLPNSDEVMTLLFPSSPEDATIDASHAKVQLRLLEGQREAATLVVAGKDATVTAGGRVFPIVFAAILRWENGEYVIKYAEVEWGEANPEVGFTRLNDGSIAFHFFNLGRDAGTDLRDERTVTVYPCRAELGALGMQGMGQLTREIRASHCF